MRLHLPAPMDQRALQQLTNTLDQSRAELSTLHPEKEDLLGCLKKSVLHTDFTAGNIDARSDHSYTFTSGWGSTLDKTVDAHTGPYRRLQP